MDRACIEHGIRKPVTLAYPGGAHSVKGVQALAHGGGARSKPEPSLQAGMTMTFSQAG